LGWEIMKSGAKGDRRFPIAARLVIRLQAPKFSK
jgi:hypothetical protein